MNYTKEDYENLKKNNIAIDGAKPSPNTRKRKKVLKINYKTIVRNSIIIIVIIAGAKFKAPIERRIDLSKANDYMSKKIVYYIEQCQLEYEIDKNNNIAILDKDENKISNLLTLMEKDNFKQNEALYGISKTTDSRSFDKVLNTIGYTNEGDFLRKNYLSNPGGIDEIGDKDKFENNVEVGYVNNIKKLQSNAEKIIEEKRGLKNVR